MTVPYTYLLVFTNPNTTEKKFYYGVRYSMLQDGWKLGPCHPDDKEKLFPSGKSSPAFGVIFTEERRNKIRQAKLRN
jgi:hypothetical protein